MSTANIFSGDVYSMLRTIVVNNVKKAQKVVTLVPITTVGDALTSLSNKHVMSAPVVTDELTQNVIGTIDLLTLVEYIVANNDKDPMAATIGDANLLGDQQDSEPLDSNTSLAHVAEMLGSGVFRFLVYSPITPDTTGNLTKQADFTPRFGIRNVYSQGDFLKFYFALLQALHAKYSELTGVGAPKITHPTKNDITIKELGVTCNFEQLERILRNAGKNIGFLKAKFAQPIHEEGKEDISKYEIASTATLEQAVAQCTKETIKCLAVINDGKLVGNFSMWDLRAVGGSDKDYLSKEHLQMTIMDFLTTRNKADAPVTCTASDSYEHILTTLMVKGFHNLWMVDEEDQSKIVGVVTGEDLIKICLKQ